MNFQNARDHLVSLLARRGVKNREILEAFRKVPREEFIDPNLREFAYGDHPLPIAEDQTISQPYVVAIMVQALHLTPQARVLEIGTGSGYAAAILSQLAAQVYTVERYQSLAEVARQRLQKLGYHNVVVAHADGTLGWEEHAPYDAIVVAAGGPSVPRQLMHQLAVGGRLLIPVGDEQDQQLVLVRRDSRKSFTQSELGPVRFVPLVGEQGWPDPVTPAHDQQLAEQIASQAEAFRSIEDYRADNWLERIGDSRVVLLGEMSHGTAEFYAMRARLTRELIQKKGFDIVAVEADWPDARALDDYAQGRRGDLEGWKASGRFPHWMWRNQEVLDFIEWLRHRNLQHSGTVGFYGLDLYSLQASIRCVLDFLDEKYPKEAALARHRYACLTPWQSDPAAYGHAVLTRTYKQCEPEVVERLLQQLWDRAKSTLSNGKSEHLDALMNSRVVSDAEQYYRLMYYGSAESWNLRDRHMFEVLKTLLDSKPGSKAVVWEHNSHLGDARATEMSMRGEYNLGQLARQAWGDQVYNVGFGTYTGKVAAADHWDGPMQVKRVLPSHERSFERLFHQTGLARFSLPLRYASADLRKQLSFPRLQRAIGVIYRPDTELASHYFHADLSRQFDEYIWFDETSPVTALSSHVQVGAAETYPFGL